MHPFMCAKTGHKDKRHLVVCGLEEKTGFKVDGYKLPVGKSIEQKGLGAKGELQSSPQFSLCRERGTVRGKPYEKKITVSSRISGHEAGREGGQTPRKMGPSGQRQCGLLREVFMVMDGRREGG